MSAGNTINASDTNTASVQDLREVAPENGPNMNHMLRWGRPICAKLGPGIDLGPKIRLATFFSKNFGGKFEFRAIFH